MDNEKKLIIWHPLPHLCPVPPAGTGAPPPPPPKESEKPQEAAAATPEGATEEKGGNMAESGAEPIFEAGEVTVSKTEPKQGESFDITFTVKDGEPPYKYAITFPPETNIQPIEGESLQAEKITATINVPESLKAGTELNPKIEVKDKNNKPVSFEGKIPKILVILSEENRTPPPGLPKFFRTGMETGVKITGYLFPILLFGIVAYFLIMIAINIGPEGKLLDKLSKPEVVRGFITFLIALGTIGIAIMLVVAAFLSNGTSDINAVKERFDMGKGVLTALIGILGTIVGFYFGAAEKTIVTTPPAGQVIQAGEVAVKELKPGESTELTFTIKEGEPQYSYTITFPAETNIPPINVGNIQGKEIKATIKIPEGTKAGLEFTPTIEIKDKNNKLVKFEGKIPKIRVKEKEKPTP